MKADSILIDPAFIFRKQSHRNGKTLVLEYGYQALADSVPAGRVSEYFRNLAEVSKCLGDEFVWK